MPFTREFRLFEIWNPTYLEIQFSLGIFFLRFHYEVLIVTVSVNDPNYC
jgi:hypothetical protein